MTNVVVLTSNGHFVFLNKKSQNKFLKKIKKTILTKKNLRKKIITKYLQEKKINEKNTDDENSQQKKITDKNFN